MTDNSIEAQCERILAKLATAKTTDSNNSAFGASTHRYGIEGKLSQNDIDKFQEKHSVILPDAYSAFLTKIGNGNQTPHLSERHMTNGCCAGPYYGLFPFGKYLSFGDNVVLSETPNISPNYSIEKWAILLERLNEPNITDEKYDAIENEVFAGILPLGHQGCSGWQGLMLLGENVGRVIYLDEDLNNPPVFTKYVNFLDWYENWLDGVISGPNTANDFEGTVYLSSRKTK